MDFLNFLKPKSKREVATANKSTTAATTGGKVTGKEKKKTSSSSRAGTATTTATSTTTKEKKWFQLQGRTPSSSSKFHKRSSSSPSLSSINHQGAPPSSINQPKSRRPITGVLNSANITTRRGAQTSSSSSNAPLNDDLSRASSTINLNSQPIVDATSSSSSSSKQKSATKPKHERNPLNSNRNNNRECELDLLRQQLHKMSAEQSILNQQLDEKDGQVVILRQEVARFKKLQEQTVFQLEQLGDENSTLRNRLRDVSHSPLSDNEKQQLLFESRHHSSAPASIATNILDGVGGDVTTCTTPEWDRQSSGNLSEVSVACLQDKIHQMQETHYSTNEELQATLQELTDLQRQLTELQQENERLIDEKKLMFGSLCRQTERLNDTRNEVESLKQLLYKNDSGHESAAEREEKLVDLLKNAQEERESLLVRIEQLESDLHENELTSSHQYEEIRQSSERIKTLESTIDAKYAEHRLIDRELAQARDQSSSRQIEINRLKDLLDNARTKIGELEQERDVGDKSELDEMLDNVRKEKDLLESEVAHLKEQLALSRNEVDKLKEQVSILVEECKVTRNNAKTTQSDLEYRVDKLVQEKEQLSEQLRQFQEAIDELQIDSQCQIDDKRQLGAVLSETQRNLNEAETKIIDLENDLANIKRQKQEQEDEWERFQNDLLTSVRVANDFKTEAQQDLQRLIMENKAERERVKQLEAQIDKLKVNTTSESMAPVMRPSLLNVEEITQRRQKVTSSLQRQNSRQSVKSLIECIEGAATPSTTATTTKSLASTAMTESSCLSRNSSTSSMSSMTSDMRTPSSPQMLRGDDWNEVKTPLKEHQANKLNRDWNKTMITDSLSKSKTDDSYHHHRGLDFSRRNSYSDLSERKDPLNGLVKNGGSKRNALLKWCQNKTVGYRNIDITNFSSSWNDGLALCALLHTYLADRIPYDSLTPNEKRRNFSLAFDAAESVGIPTTLNVNDMIQLERPDWQQVMSYVTAIYKHFET